MDREDTSSAGWGTSLDRNKHANIAHSVELSMKRLGEARKTELKFKFKLRAGKRK
jgi:hypothetical protein